MDLQDRPHDGSAACFQEAESSAGPKRAASIVKLDPAASAALAAAVESRRTGPGTASGLSGPAPAVGEQEPAQGTASRLRPGYRGVVQAAAALALIGAGWLASYAGTLANREAIQRVEAETARSQEILARLSGDLEALKVTLATFQETAQATSKTSAADRTALAEKVERLAIAVQDPGAKISALETRLARMEDQVAAGKPSGAEAPADRRASNEPVDGWVLREVYNGAALVEGRDRRLYEVMPGAFVPGMGRVEAIERRGSRWVVLTDRGIIGSYR